MKLLLLCAASALAVQDVTPPVMSLTLPDVYQHSTAGYTGRHKDGVVRKNGFVRTKTSVVCEVGDHADDIQACPEPTCKAYDHHDGDLGSCQKKYIMVNDDNTALDATAQGADYTFSSIHRTLRSEWLIEFNAEDHSGNKADTMTFTMIFRDTLAPTLTTEFGTSNLWRATNMVDTLSFRSPSDDTAAYATFQTRSWAESCSDCGTGDDTSAAAIAAGCKSAATNPCVHLLSTTHTSVDKYDGDVKANTLVSVTKPDGTASLVATKLHGISAALLSINTHVLGKWVVSYTASDNAGAFGYNQQSNSGVQHVNVYVSDNTKPVITLNPHAPGPLITSTVPHTIALECAKTSGYVEPGAQCHDRRESWTGTGTGWSDEDADVGGADMAAAGRTIANTDAGNVHVVTYDCNDGQGNNAEQKTRTTTVQDTTAPVITLHGDRAIQTSAGNHAHYVQNSAGSFHGHKDGNGDALKTIFEKSGGLDMSMLGGTQGATCTDSCSTTTNAQITAVLYHGKVCGADGKGSMGAITNFPEYVAGDYSILYTCYDGTGAVSADQTTFTNANARAALTATACRFIDNVDHTRPIIQILGSDEMTLEASHQGNYVDDGATCSDQVDGVISQNVEVSGDVVNLSKVGTYQIVYNCKDSAGNTADEAMRTVHIAQTSCPKCAVSDCTGGYGTSTYDCTTTHEASFPYTDAGAVCTDEIDGNLAYNTINPVDVEMTGDYTVTYRARNSVGLWSDGSTCRQGAEHYFRTVQVRDTLKPIISVKYNGVEVARGSATDKAVHNGAANPVANHVFMAEAAPMGGRAWLAGAAASAVAGLALLAHGRRAQARAVSVPV